MATSLLEVRLRELVGKRICRCVGLAVILLPVICAGVARVVLLILFVLFILIVFFALGVPGKPSRTFHQARQARHCCPTSQGPC